MPLNTLKKRVVSYLGPWLVWGAIKLLSRTIKVEEIHSEIPKSFWERGIPFIGAFWHGRLLMMPIAYRGKKLSFLVSPHRDGQVVGKALKRLGFNPILGSTYRKGFSAFKKMAKALANGSDIGFVPDGPRGPRYRAQIGVIELAKRTGRPIIPLSFSASKKKILNTWDQFLLPYPFSKGVFIWGDPIEVDPNGTRDHLEERRILLEKRLNELTEKADRYFDAR